ncbi:hypothetical protein AN189_03125 [Loktanella sp. 3ANDIMAR09]|uniref:TadE/TadG family type IV pilus assembly protein n=1 Tax=Loktanella sp. 3ANDIMAR09 TaxID=1225657 RepID=UPI0007004995|nr:pilus assembly protein [Loktanella sp. 3ANDIMAR09]KQI69425.1 hypothetical protein AN189_03125 [Loktanella sp. 3ANDIMAR09]
MIAFIRKVMERLRPEDGSASVPFLIVAPAFFFIFVNAFEIQVHSVRQVMVDRALDLAVRDVRVGYLKKPTHDDLTARICYYSKVIENCERDIRLEMIKVDPRNWVTPAASAPCRDREEEETDFPIGSLENNDLMILRVCVLFDPTFNYAGVGRKVVEPGQEYYALRAASSYVVEPYQ